MMSKTRFHNYRFPVTCKCAAKFHILGRILAKKQRHTEDQEIHAKKSVVTVKQLFKLTRVNNYLLQLLKLTKSHPPSPPHRVPHTYRSVILSATATWTILSPNVTTLPTTGSKNAARTNLIVQPTKSQPPMIPRANCKKKWPDRFLRRMVYFILSNFQEKKKQEINDSHYRV